MMIPELPELPEIQAQSVLALRRRGTIQTPLPAIGVPNLGTADLVGYNIRAIEAARYAEAIRVAFEITRRQNMIANARAREIDRQAQVAAQRRRGWWR